MTMFVDT